MPDPILQHKVIVLGITGSIAAYKAADLASSLTQSGACVYPVLTPEATRFIRPLTLSILTHNPAATTLWEEGNDRQPGHIELADKADLLLVAPATAHCIANFAHGLTPDLLSSIYLATEAPVILAPAMNGKMLTHPATQFNLQQLQNRGHTIIDPASGILACGYQGHGKLAPLEPLINAVCKCLKTASLAEDRPE